MTRITEIEYGFVVARNRGRDEGGNEQTGLSQVKRGVFVWLECDTPWVSIVIASLAISSSSFVSFAHCRKLDGAGDFWFLFYNRVILQLTQNEIFF